MLWFVIIMALIGVGALFMNDSTPARQLAERCPKCGAKGLVRRPGSSSAAESRRVCARCGNDEDEFGNKL